MIDKLAHVYKPIRTPDEEGGFYFEISESERVFLNIAYHANVPYAYVRKGSVVLNLEDTLEISGEFYRVTNKIFTNVTEYYKVDLEKIERPIGL